ncbi:MAG: nitroreductase family deazaflavin-dependent oxidoreductase [Caldilineaceae bacterium]|nr:nitroreductase family deazaflavin-dependent oxidoreductase [Caldilineaceae bacterium]
MKVMANVHARLLQLSGGRIGNKMGGMDVLLLHHIGAKSGKEYRTPLAFVKEGDAFVVVAGAAGQPNHPGWYYNLRHHPETTVEIAGKTIPVVAEIAPQETRDRIWAEVAAHYPQYEKFQSMTTRVIPVILLHRR